MRLNAKSLSTLEAGPCAALGVLLRGPGSRARHFVLSALLALALFLAFGVLPVSAGAASPSFGAGLGGSQMLGLGTASTVPAAEPVNDPLTCAGQTHTSIAMQQTYIDLEGLTTHWSFSYSEIKGGPWKPVPGGEGTLSPGDNNSAEALLTGLTPEVSYYILLTIENSAGIHTQEAVESDSGKTEPGCETSPIRALPSLRDVFNVTATSGRIVANVLPGDSETHWHFEYATAESGPWTLVPGGEGTISKAEAEGYQAEAEVESGANAQRPEAEAKLAGLTPGSTYYVRLFAESEPEFPPGSGEKHHREATSKVFAFKTQGPPAVLTYALHALHGEATRGLGSVTPGIASIDELQSVTVGGGATGGTFKLCFESQCTGDLPFDANAEAMRDALWVLPTVGAGNLSVDGPANGVYTVQFEGPFAGRDLPEMTADRSGLTPSGSVTVTPLENGFSYDSHYHFEYVSQAQFEAAGREGGFAKALSTPEVDLGPGESTDEMDAAGADFPGLEAGETYHYRLTATNTTPGDPVVHGVEQVLTVPAAPPAGAGGSCPNEAFRVGPSAQLPDCRAYEQVSPHDKEGSIQPFRYGSEIGAQGALIGEDGDHLMLDEEFTHWGTGTTDGSSPYFFAREEGGKDWKMTAGTPQPEAGPAVYNPELVSPDLTGLALSSAWKTGTNESPDVEFKTGPPGGPYVTVVSVPRKQLGPEGHFGWLAASEDFSKLVLGVEDRTLAGHRTGTSQGTDLYEYAGGRLRQVNVTGPAPGTTIGTCGAQTPIGRAEYNASFSTSSSHAVSADGSRVFFEAVPGGGCSEPTHLYVRIDGERTLDLGAYAFLAANPQGTEVLLESANGEILLYDTESTSTKVLFDVPREARSVLKISQDFSTIYFASGEHLTPEAPSAVDDREGYLYRYDVGGGTLRFISSLSNGGDQQASFETGSVSPDGRYLYWHGAVPGLPAGGPLGKTNEEATQMMLYDSTENVVECVSCASPFDPEPRLPATDGRDYTSRFSGRNGSPGEALFSGNGDFAFFSAAAALVPKDVNGEIEKPVDLHAEGRDIFTTLSSDVYEWRRDGVYGCVHVQGCVSLISSGGAGYLVLLLGSADEGRDVFFTTRSQLGPNDNDNDIDIYDARIDGGEPPLPPRPVECEGDACSTPPSAPNDSTPSSLTFTGSGNLAEPAVKPAVKPTKPKAKTKQKTKKKTKKSRKQRKAKKSSHDLRGK